jgi:hypothetical protein
MGETHLSAQLRGIVDENGEGVVLRKIGSVYENGRNKSLIKMKVYILEGFVFLFPHPSPFLLSSPLLSSKNCCRHHSEIAKEL